LKNLIYTLIVVLFTFTSIKSTAQNFSLKELKQINSLNDLINNQTCQDSVMVNTYLELANLYYTQNPDTAITFCKSAETISKEINYIQGLSDCYAWLGFLLEIQGNISLALDYNQKCLKIQKDIGDVHGMATSFHNIGYIYKNIGDISLALVYYHKSLKIKEEIGDKIGASQTLNGIGVIHDNQGDTTLALEFYLKSLKIREDINDRSGIASCLNNIGVIYDSQSNFHQALKYYYKGLEIQQEIGDKQGAGTSLYNIGGIYKDQAKLNKSNNFNFQDDSLINLAMECFHKSLKIFQEIGDKKGETITRAGLGNLYLLKGLIVNAKKMGLRGLVLAQELGFPSEIERNASLLSKVYLKEGNYKLAFEMRDLEIQMRDSLLSEENMKAAVQQQAKFEYEKQKVADSIFNAEAEKVHLASLETEKAKGEQQKTEIAAQKKQNIFLFVGLGLVALFGFFMYNRFKVTQKQKGIIEEQKITVEKTLHELKEIHVRLESTHEQLEESHKEITDSINYAERIQRSFLASKELLDEHFGLTLSINPESDVSRIDPNYFVFFKPKDIVSGDFYWASQLNNRNFAFCCADSTGHGVPGAIMSILNISSLEKAIENGTDPHLILNKTRDLIIQRLKKDGSPEGGKDGMDCSLLVINQDKTQLSFAAANNPVFIVRKTPPILTIREGKGGVELLEFKPDKMPVGKHDKDQTTFTLQTVQLQKGDIIYTLTDGFPDQFGGEKGKKYMIKNLKELLLTIAHIPMKEQEERMLAEFTAWKGENEQVDDVCIIGVRV
jgi:serine phosphatase RsbU (regulator of sigma subunit)